MKRIALLVCTALAIAALNSCDSHSWEKTKVLHSSHAQHGDAHAKDAPHGDAPAKEPAKH